MSTPQRIQLRRIKGWRLPEGAMAVTRPGKFGNPFTERDVVASGTATPEYARQTAVDLFASWVDEALGVQKPPQERRRAILLAHLHQLRGRDLACHCAPPAPGEPDVCHAAWLIRRVNRPRTPDRPGENGGRIVTVQRACNGCGEELGDATDRELINAVYGLPIPDVRGECLRCGPAYAAALMAELRR